MEPFAPPGQDTDAAGVCATTRLAGRLSTKLAPVNGTAFGLVSVMVTVDGTLGCTLVGLNDLAMVTGVRTVRIAVAGTGLSTWPPPMVPSTSPALMLLV